MGSRLLQCAARERLRSDHCALELIGPMADQFLHQPTLPLSTLTAGCCACCSILSSVRRVKLKAFLPSAPEIAAHWPLRAASKNATVSARNGSTSSTSRFL